MHQELEFDVVVVGGGLAGFSAAVAAARHGARTCLVQDRPVLGGNSSSEIRVTPHGAAAFHAYARESGIIAEALIEERRTNHEVITENGWTNSVWDLTLYDMAVRTAGLDLRLNTSVEGLETRPDGSIASVTARVANAETLLTLRAATFIDATGDGSVADLAGNAWRSGTESRAEFGEPHAPDEPTDGVMGSSLHFKTVDTGRPVEFHAPDWAVHYDDDRFFYEGGRVPKTLRSGYWWIEIGPPFDTIHDNERIRHELTRHVLGIWDYLKNRDERWREEASTLALDWIGQVPGKRESRRVEGRHLLTENELIDREVFPDEIAFGGWYVDLHTLGGLLADTSEPLNARELDPTSEYGASTNVGPFGLPLRILLARDVPNLMLAGRNVSATHAAMGSIRVMSTGAVLGQAAGTAAAVAVEAGTAAADVPIERVQQALLRDGCFLPNTPADDPLDLAPAATVRASSTELLHEASPESHARLGGLGQWTDHPVFPNRGVLEHRTAQWIALGPDRDLRRIELLLAADDAPRRVRATLHAVDDIWDYRAEAGEPIATTELEVTSSEPTWVSWDLDGIDRSRLPAGGYVRVSLDATPGITWQIAGTVQPGNLAAYEAMPGRYRRFGGGTTLSFRVEPAQACYGPENITSGVTRPHRSPNVWRSEPGATGSPWIELSWPEERSIRQVQITFAGNLLREYHAYPPGYRDPQTANEYVLEAREDDVWRPVAEVSGNATTRVVHTFPEAIRTSALRLTVLATNGDPSAAVSEIRCYEGTPCTEPAFPEQLAAGTSTH
ncbi:FAD-dependent oxidoreductase [Pseudoclavibacter chungangensis]|uniref:FAD-dependent oxidoreductase n=1 Tax=Pseudoclavibacter chungangensis TaxID=587635 RepID=A0A7J5BNU3_9MICO|nr:FAD-dependent oxidoreductase [Pseudoclavibacter chungangensis]KAB1654094.1 FAD-dependent oxidoreductase [Pseudoclavibacter chungangensis]